MAESQRDLYRECAAFISAACEVVASMGYPDTKQKTMGYYRNIYPRRSSFINELRNFGYEG